MGMSVQTIRLNTTASNMANAETSASSEAEAYKALRPVFVSSSEKNAANGSLNGSSPADFGVMVREIVESQAPLTREYLPDHPMADDNGFIFRSNVNVVEEMANMMSASRAYETNVQRSEKPTKHPPSI